MKISDASSAEAAGHVQPVASPDAKQTEPAVAPGSTQDQVSLWSVALAASRSLDAPEAKIAELREQYLDGTYHVATEKLSAKIVKEHLQQE